MKSPGVCIKTLGLEVAPLAGAWIEILAMDFLTKSYVSLPSRERGLKSHTKSVWRSVRRKVAPLAGAWIEIILAVMENLLLLGRSPRGSVD